MRIESGGVDIYVEVSGPADGTPVVLLHGFPDTGRLWAAQVDALSEAGYRVIVPDQRGYGRSDKPEGVDAYDMLYLVADMGAVLDHLEVPRAHLVGHDWGAAVAWVTASLAADRVDHLAVLSVGHPTALRRAGLEQREKSWYMLLFQFEGIAETWLTADDWLNFRRWGRHPQSEEVIASLIADSSLTPALNWYRANLHPRSLVGPPPALPAVNAPTMGLWGTEDFALLEQQMLDSANYVTGPWTYQRIEGAGHWIQLDAPGEVNRLLLDFFAT